eukprot:6542625-Prymnesium_polylepis.1
MRSTWLLSPLPAAAALLCVGRPQIMPITEFEPEMDKINRKLGKEGHALLITEEVLGGRLYTGPMYHKVRARWAESWAEP